MVRYLTDNGQDPLGRDSRGWTPLHYAARSCNVLAFETLLQVLLGGDGLRLSEAKRMAAAQTPSCIADEKFGPHGKLMEYVNVADDEGKSPLHMVATARRLPGGPAAEENKQAIVEIRDMVRLLLNLGAKLNFTAGSKTPLLSLLAPPRQVDHGGVRGAIELLKHGEIIAAIELLDQGANPNLPDMKGATPLHHGTRGWDDEVVESLLNAGADIEAKDCDLCTPLHWACRYLSKSSIIWLLRHNANYGARDRMGATPLHYAADAQHPDIVDVIQVLIKKGADVQSADWSGVTPLHRAAKAGRRLGVASLIRYGANPEAVDMAGKTAMHYAAEQASIIKEHEDKFVKYTSTWLQLYKCSEKWCQRNMTRPHTLLKRSHSQILRIDQSWGDFSQIKSKELARP